MYLPPWFAAALAALNGATSPTPGASPDQPAPVYMATDGQLFMSVDKIEEGAVARLVK
jgi:enterochelin esterase-like enzyme